MKKGKIIADDKPDKLLNSIVISNLFDINIEIFNLKGYWRAIPIEAI